MADTPKERKRGKRRPNVWDWVDDAERAGKRVKSLTWTLTFEEPGGTAESKQMSMDCTDAEIEEFAKRKGHGEA